MARFLASRSPDPAPWEAEHSALARRVAGECVVLLENRGVLPLTAPGPLALYGNGARGTVRGGTGSGEVNARASWSVEDGLEDAGFTITTRPWLDRQQARDRRAREDWKLLIARKAEEHGYDDFLASFYDPFSIPAPVPILEEDIAGSGTETAVYVLSRVSGEGADRWNRRGDYLLYEEERAQLEQLGKAYRNLVVVLNIGGVMDLSEITAIPGLSALVLMSQLGASGGLALADVLTGAVCPSGRLTDSWPARYEDCPSAATFSHNNGNLDDEFYEEGLYVGYRYYDTFGDTFGVEPLYPFGYGLSCTSFSLEPQPVRVEGDRIQVPVTVRNTGSRPGKETVQLYVSSPAGELPKPYQDLRAFRKTGLLAPGERETVTLTLHADDLSSFSPARSAWILEAGEYQLRVGIHSRSTVPVAVLTLARTIPVRTVRPLDPDPAPVQERSAHISAAPPAPPEVPRLALDPSAIPLRRVALPERPPLLRTDIQSLLTAEDVREGRCSLEDLVAQLSLQELAALCVGVPSPSGETSPVPGAAGYTLGLPERGIPSLVLADGPAGLRLLPVFRVGPDGERIAGGEVLGDLSKPFDPAYPEGTYDTYWQYSTSLPIGWALAQSWNPEALEELGALVGREMETFGVDLWLAPALNLHRNPLCGRCFEYFSEDPLVSGRMAAALVRGVQSRPGRGATLKHFAANSQEDNRFFTNAHIGERTLRELYLKGFEIALRECRPMALMTSYNLINGTHTANRRDLLTDLARDEWGFPGFVMTDWNTSQESYGWESARWPISSSVGCVFAGNDVQMPGCDRNREDLIRAVESGEETDGFSLSLPDLQACALRLLRAVLFRS